MKQSQLFTKTRKEAPADEVSKNAQLLIRAGYVHKEMAGVYSYLPLGLKVIDNLKNIVREEMNNIGGQEISLTALQNKETWERTGRWNDAVVDNWFKTEFKSGGETGLGITHEEPLTAIMAEYIQSYRDLPKYAYQFQTKFRNELRAKSGIMRGKEFLMKDLYSFSRTDTEHAEFYEKASEAYMKVFARAGLGGITMKTFASGGIFSEFSDEFQTISDAGEDTVFVDTEKGISINQEVMESGIGEKLGIDTSKLIEKKSIEVGNIFNLGTKFSDKLDLNYKDEKGEQIPVIMGSYGIGITRLMGTIVEVLSDEKGIVWPESVAPFRAHLLCLSPEEQTVKSLADDIYKELDGAVLYDDREGVRAGEKFADADLIGIPYQIIVGKKSHQDAVEVKNRQTGKTVVKSMTEIIEWLS